jgi:glycine/sarcosine/betaine reductase complex component A
MDPENQALIKRIVEEIGSDDVVVILGAADAEAVEVAAQTVRDGDPAWVGPLAGVQLGLPVLHVFEDEVKRQTDPLVYDEQIGFFAMTLDVEPVNQAMRRARNEEPTDEGQSNEGQT